QRMGWLCQWLGRAGQGREGSVLRERICVRPRRTRAGCAAPAKCTCAAASGEVRLERGFVAAPARACMKAQSKEYIHMAIYEMRTYTLYVGKMAEATKLYQEFGFPALKKGAHDSKLVGYFQGDTGIINQLVHIWKFEDDADRRRHWAA